ncbi:hypothetical protein HanPSC8_Chr16g0696441 [Helianthus annuus]|nr:hypothetical protein HanPSC8_Chr16g0696441 [Helianthus annuus]
MVFIIFDLRNMFSLEKITKLYVDQTCFQICHAPASLERCFMPGMRPSSTGCVLITKPNKKWTCGPGMRPSSTGCVLQTQDASLEHGMSRAISDYDDFMSVNGGKIHLITNYVLVLNEWSPSKWWYMCRIYPIKRQYAGHHNFSAGNNKPPVVVSPNQPSPHRQEKKMRLSDLFNDSLRGNYDSDNEDDGEAMKRGVNSKNESPLVRGDEVAPNGGNVLKTKRERFGSCFPSLLSSSRSSSMNGRKMMSRSYLAYKRDKEKREMREKEKRERERGERERGERKRRIKIRSEMRLGPHVKRHVSNFY